VGGDKGIGREEEWGKGREPEEDRGWEPERGRSMRQGLRGMDAPEQINIKVKSQ
jgi:hypothetical protein